MSKFERNLKYIREHSFEECKFKFYEVDPIILYAIKYDARQPFNVFRFSATLIRLGCSNRKVSAVFEEWFSPKNHEEEELQIFATLRSAVNSMCKWVEVTGALSPVRAMIDRLDYAASLCDKVLENVIHEYYADGRAGVTRKSPAASEWFDKSFKELLEIVDTFKADDVWPEYLHVVHNVKNVYMTADAKFNGESWCGRVLSIAIACGYFCLNDKSFDKLIKQRINDISLMKKAKHLSFKEIVTGIRKDYKAGRGWNWMAHMYGVHHKVAMAIINPHLPVESWPIQRMIDSCAKVGASREEIRKAIPIILPKDFDYYNIANKDHTDIEELRVVKGTRADFTLKQTMDTIVGSEDRYVDYRKVRTGLSIVIKLLSRTITFDSLREFVDECGVSYITRFDDNHKTPVGYTIAGMYDPTLKEIIDRQFDNDQDLGNAYLYNVEGELIKELFERIINGKIALKALIGFTLMNDKQ